MEFMHNRMLEARKQFKISNPRNTSLPTDISGQWGKECTIEWVSKQIQKRIDEEGIDANIIEYEINMCIGCETRVNFDLLQNVA